MNFAKNKIGICNIGDSKIFQLTKGDIQQISYDHIGASAFGVKPPLTQNLGIPENEMIISPYIATGAYLNGDKYLICSDGLTDMVDIESIKRIMCDNTNAIAAKMLLDEALKKGGKDNITFILISIEKSKRLFMKKKGKKTCL